MRKRQIRALLAASLAGALALVFVAGVEAHARYLRSDPGEGAVVSTAPERVDIWFTQELFRRQGENWILVFGPAGGAVQNGEAQIDDDDRRHMWVDLQSQLPPGQYRVEWRNLSAEDGDTADGEFTFDFDPRAAVTSTPMGAATDVPMPTKTSTAEPTPRSQPTESGASPVAEDFGSTCPLGLTPVVGLALFGLARKRRRL